MPEERQDDFDDMEKPPSFFPLDELLGEEESEFEPGEPVEVRVEAVYAAQANDTIQRFVLLSDGTRKLPIIIGPFEATSITYSLEGQQPDRPMTHDLFKKVMDRLGAEIDKIVIDDLMSGTYYAKIFIMQGDEEIVIDSRPSDAIALAVRADAPIFVAEGILQQHAH
jgi:hypothetical protein